MPKDYDKFIDRAVANYRKRCETRFEVQPFPVAEGRPDREKSYVDIRAGIPHVVVSSTEGDPVAFYRIQKNGRLRFMPAPMMLSAQQSQRLRTGAREGLIGRRVVKM